MLVEQEKKFNIRVYGLLLNEKNEILVSDEQRRQFQFTKFPGGGLEWGEGLIDCLKREFQEELQLEIEVEKLYYVTDFFQVSAFHPQEQIISMYYFVSSPHATDIPTGKVPVYTQNKELHRWIPLANMAESDFTFPIDRHVAALLKKDFHRQ